jgi:ATP-dependent Clp protease ATP-binding subunit ClpC
MTVFERYTEPARRAIFFSLWHARLGEEAAIDSVHLLRGLTQEENSRANTIFQLREQFPIQGDRPSRFATHEDVPKPDLPLNPEAKRILARTAWEANAMRDYWIDNEHLLLGVLAEPRCQAAQYLAKAGLSLKHARRAIIENKSSRPDYGPVPELWSVQSPWDRLVFKWRMRKYQS